MVLPASSFRQADVRGLLHFLFQTCPILFLQNKKHTFRLMSLS